MISDSKVLVIFETSVIRNPNYPYKEINLGSIFGSINQFINENNLGNSVKIAITKFSIDELIQGRNEEYLKDNKVIQKFQGLSNFSFPKTEFNYLEYTKGKIKLFLKNSNILVIPYPSEKSLYSISKRGLLKRKPFHVSDKHSDYGFKDVIIWQSILEFRKIKDFDKVFLIAVDNGFDSSCVEEFKEKYKCGFEICKDHTNVIEEIKKDIEDNNSDKGAKFRKKINNFISSEYFIDSLQEFINENYESVQLLKHSMPKNSFQYDEIDQLFSNIKIFTTLDIEGEQTKILTSLDDTFGIKSHEFYEDN